MIWFFLAGMVAGAVGMVMLAEWWFHSHVICVTKEEMETGTQEENQNEEEKTDD